MNVCDLCMQKICSAYLQFMGMDYYEDRMSVA